MIKSWFRWMKGYVRVRVEGCSAERFLNLCSHHRIFLWGLVPTSGAFELYMDIQGFRKIRPLVRKTHTKVSVQGRYGLPFFLFRYRKRKLSMLSVLLCIGLLCFYSSFIWDIHFEGNEKWTNETLLEFLESKNVSAHMPKSKVDCAQIVKDIRAEYDDIVWVSASIDGSRLRIQIKENEDEFLDSEEVEETPMDLIATKDGVITEIITRSGVPQVHIGDVVTQGQLLVSGRIDVKNDSAEVVDYQYQVSDADIYADTQMEYEYTIPTTYQEKVYGHRQQKIQYYFQIGSLEFAIGNLDHTFEESEESSVMHQIKLGENFYLPIYYGYRQIKSYTSQEKTYTRREIQEILTKEFQLFLNELEEKGIQIKENNVRIELSDSSATAKGTIYLNERITTQTQTEVIQVERTDTNESDGTND